MKKKQIKNRWERWAQAGLLLAIIVRISLFIAPFWHGFIESYYDDAHYQDLARVFGNSQYRQKHPTAIIPDETVFSYASGAYIRGVDPILINSEHTPLGKYMIGVFIVLFKNDRVPMLVFAVLTLVSMYILARTILPTSALALIPVVFFVFEPLFLNQLKYVPLLDLVQLPFILLTLVAFLRESQKDRYLWTSVFLGFTAATKTIVPAVILVGVFLVTFLVFKKFQSIVKLLVYLPIAAAIFIISYLKTFLDGYTFWQFLGFQKWIFAYQKSKLLYPFSAWRLIFLNQWQTWWGDFSLLRAEDWQVTWPASIVGTIGFGLGLLKKRSIAETTLFFWCIAYSAFLSLGVVSSRFFLPFFPVTYILTTAWVVTLIQQWRKR